jgi:hypothetical protein
MLKYRIIGTVFSTILRNRNVSGDWCEALISNMNSKVEIAI